MHNYNILLLLTVIIMSAVLTVHFPFSIFFIGFFIMCSLRLHLLPMLTTHKLSIVKEL